MWACGIDNTNINMAKQLLNNKNIILNKKNSKNDTAFSIACVCQPEIAIEMLKRNNIDFNIQDEDGNTGFMWACLNQPKLVFLMLENNKINKSLKNNEGETAFDLAKEYNHQSYQIYKNFIENDKLSNNSVFDKKPRAQRILL